MHGPNEWQRSQRRIKTEVERVEETIEWLKDISMWYIEYPLHQGTAQDDDGAWPKDNISVLLEPSLLNMDRGQWSALAKEIGFDVTFDSESSANTDITMRPFGEKSNWNMLQIRIYKEKMLSIGKAIPWEAYLKENNPKTVDNPQQRVLKTFIAYARAKNEGWTERREGGARSNSKSQKRSRSHSKEGEQRKRKKNEQGSGKKNEEDVEDNQYVVSALTSDEEEEEQPLKKEIKKEEESGGGGIQVHLITSSRRTRSSASTQSGGEMEKEENPQTPQSSKQKKGEARLLSESPSLSAVDILAPYADMPKETANFMLMEYKGAMTMLEAEECRKWYGEGRGQEGDAKHLINFNRFGKILLAAYDIFVTTAVTAKKETEISKRALEKKWNKHFEAVKAEGGGEASGLSRFEDFQREVQTTAVILKETVKRAKALSEEAVAMKEWQKEQRERKRKERGSLKAEDPGKTKQENAPDTFNLEVYQKGISLCSQTWEQEVHRCQMAQRQRYQQEEEERKKKAREEQWKNGVQIKTSHELWEKLKVQILKQVKVHQMEVMQKEKVEIDNIFTEMEMNVKDMRENPDSYKENAYANEDTNKSFDLFDHKKRVTGLLTKHLANKMKNAENEEKQKLWTPANARSRAHDFRKRIKVWILQAEQAIGDYKVDLRKRLEKFKGELELIEEAQNFQFDLPENLLEGLEEDEEEQNQNPDQEEEFQGGEGVMGLEQNENPEDEGDDNGNANQHEHSQDAQGSAEEEKRSDPAQKDEMSEGNKKCEQCGKVFGLIDVREYCVHELRRHGYKDGKNAGEHAAQVRDLQGEFEGGNVEE